MLDIRNLLPNLTNIQAPILHYYFYKNKFYIAFRSWLVILSFFNKHIITVKNLHFIKANRGFFLLKKDKLNTYTLLDSNFHIIDVMSLSNAEISGKLSSYISNEYFLIAIGKYLFIKHISKNIRWIIDCHDKIVDFFKKENQIYILTERGNILTWDTLKKNIKPIRLSQDKSIEVYNIFHHAFFHFYLTDQGIIVDETFALPFTFFQEKIIKMRHLHVLVENYQPKKKFIIFKLKSKNKKNEFSQQVKDFFYTDSTTYVAFFQSLIRSFNNVILDSIPLENRVYCFDVLNPHIILLGNQDGLFLFNTQSNSSYMLNKGNISKISHDAKSFYISTFDNGFLKYDKTTFKKTVLFTQNLLSSNFAISHAVNQEKIFVLSSTSVDFIDINKFRRVTLPLSFFSTQYRFVSVDFDTLNNQLLLATSNYIYFFNKSLIDSLLNFPLRFYHFYAEGNNKNNFLYTTDSLTIRAYAGYPLPFKIKLNAYLVKKNNNDTILSKSLFIINGENSFTFKIHKPGSYALILTEADGKILYSLTFHVNKPWYLSTLWIGIFISTFLIIFSLIFRFMLILIKKNYSKKEEILNLQLQSLYLQLQPHFFHNVLNSIISLIRINDIEGATTYIISFSKFLRQLLTYTKEKETSLENEIIFLTSYLNFEKIRLIDKLDYKITNLCPDLNNTMIPTLCIQPCIENSIKHGFSPDIKKLFISLTFYQKEQKIICKIKDNGKGFNTSANPGRGLELIKKRLFLFNKSYYVIMPSIKGTIIEIHFRYESR